MKNEFELISPWTNFYRELESLFKNDPEVKVVEDDKNKIVKLYVDNPVKAAALGQLLPVKKVLGNITVEIQVIPGNDDNYRAKLFQEAFKGNPAFVDLQSVNSKGWMADYIIFKNEVVQYKADDLSDINGVCSTLYEDIARDVFENTFGIYFCTELNK